MINGLFVLILATSMVGGFVMIPRAAEHDRLFEEPEDIDYDLLDAERDTRAADDADAARKEHGF
ncbi:hypothetical protein AB0O52_17425 [Arthrobacter sp. NPDC080073]|uniref:hypothetical protein n=1 Tax=Arthrobacter sp. NPDC080073 TaxID=3155919 RepID=UPI003420F5FB